MVTVKIKVLMVSPLSWDIDITFSVSFNKNLKSDDIVIFYRLATSARRDTGHGYGISTILCNNVATTNPAPQGRENRAVRGAGTNASGHASHSYKNDNTKDKKSDRNVTTTKKKNGKDKTNKNRNNKNGKDSKSKIESNKKGNKGSNKSSNSKVHVKAKSLKSPKNGESTKSSFDNGHDLDFLFGYSDKLFPFEMKDLKMSFDSDSDVTHTKKRKENDDCNIKTSKKMASTVNMDYGDPWDLHALEKEIDELTKKNKQVCSFIDCCFASNISLDHKLVWLIEYLII